MEEVKKMDSKRPSSTVFRESDYHTPSPRSKRRRRLLERKSTACLCTCFCIFLVILLALSVAVGLRVTGARKSFVFEETLGDTRLVEFNPSYCRGIGLETRHDVPATLYLLKDRPPLTGWSNISVDSSFIITQYKEYIDSYGWYDYGDFEYAVDIDYVTWNFHLNKGSEIEVEACVDTKDASATFILIEGKSNYEDWEDSYDSFTGYPIPLCSADQENRILYSRTVPKNNEYYFVFNSPSDVIDLSPRINMTLSLHRTEYIVDSTSSSSCVTEENTCSLDVALNGPTYSLVQTNDKETEDIKFGDKVGLEWKCIPRDWVYVLIFFCPVVFFTCLFVSMYCIVIGFWSRKLRSYRSLHEEITSDNNSTYKIVYEHPNEKRSINLLSSSK